MPGTFIGSTSGTSYPAVRREKTLHIRYGHMPDQKNRVANASFDGQNRHEPWVAGELVGGEETGMYPFHSHAYDEDTKVSGTKAFSYTIRGQCLDSSGVAVPGATVQLWLSYPKWDGANEPRLLGNTVSDELGNYGFAVADNTTTYFVVAYTSAKGGVTVRNLTGA